MSMFIIQLLVGLAAVLLGGGLLALLPIGPKDRW